MKKIIFALATIVAFSSLAQAGNLPTGATFTFKPSANVSTSYFVDSTKQNYVANSKHTAGNRTYSSSNTTSTIWYKEVAANVGKTLTAAGNEMTNPGESTYSGWTSN
jgi:hypothetical protein